MGSRPKKEKPPRNPLDQKEGLAIALELEGEGRIAEAISTIKIALQIELDFSRGEMAPIGIQNELIALRSRLEKSSGARATKKESTLDETSEARQAYEAMLIDLADRGLTPGETWEEFIANWREK